MFVLTHVSVSTAVLQYCNTVQIILSCSVFVLSHDRKGLLYLSCVEVKYEQILMNQKVTHECAVPYWCNEE